jgi:dienelactone hydrolase
MAGPYDFTPDEPDIMDMFGPPSHYPRMQVTHFVDGGEPPMFLMWGDKDTVVKITDMQNLSTAIHQKNACVKTEIYPGINHAWLVGSLSWLGDRDATILPDMVDFFRHPVCAAPSP